MKLTICAVKDRAVDAFNRPMFVQTAGQAMRAFGDEYDREDSEIRKHPEDYDLYELGTFDDNHAKFEIHDSPRLLVRAQDYKINDN